MKYLILAIVVSAMCLSGIPQSISFSPGSPHVEVPVATTSPTSSYPGPASRQADHATIAINDSLDIAVAFHTDRTDAGSKLKQVEVAFFKYDPVNSAWSHDETIVVGSIDYDPLGSQYQREVKCERPDIIAVGDLFFVTWTRRYREGHPTLEHHPAILECAWIESGPVGLIVHADPANPGKGFALQSHIDNPNYPNLRFEVLDCAGVPDAVELTYPNQTTSVKKVGVAYPHQTVFTVPGVSDREFDLRFVTCTFDTVGNIVNSSTPIALETSIPFDGPNSTAGLILPDLAPSSEDNAFWLTYESQIMSPIENGTITLEYRTLNQAMSTWDIKASRAFSSSSILETRRRPNVSSFPQQGAPHTVSIAFNNRVTGSGPSANITYEELEYLPGLPGQITTPISGGISPWPNSVAYDDAKPVPLHGSTGVRRCYATRINPVNQNRVIGSFDPSSGILDPIEYITNPSYKLGRPAVSYGPPHTAFSFEAKLSAIAFRRIWIGVE